MRSIIFLIETIWVQQIQMQLYQKEKVFLFLLRIFKIYIEF